MSRLSIGEVARLSNIGVQAIRYYEREGLIPAPARRASGYRMYETEIVQRLEFISRAKSLGFSLQEIRELLSLQDEIPGNRSRVRALATHKLEELRTKIRDLKLMETVLAALVEDCSGRGPVRGCPIIESLHGEQEPG